MKNSFFLVALLCSIAFFNSCKKDNDQDLPEQVTEAPKTETNARRSCGMHDHMTKLNTDPEYRKAHQEKLAKVKNMVSERAACNDPVILPMAVHFQGIQNPDESCLRQLAQSQIDILNADYSGTNSDITNWTNNAASFFPGVSNGEACIQFCIATQNHPAGSGIANGDPAVTINATSGDFSAAWSGYLNIFVQANTGVLGYSPLGGSGNGDGVVIDANAFGAGSGCGSISPNAPYDLGRTLTHELGHYLLLDHIWGGGCGQDDDVADTPDAADSNYDCPNLGVSSCGSTDMHMNYMDYTNDACMYMFSAGQATRMENYVSSSLQNLISNGATVCQGGGGGNPATCTDGIQNGNETGVDCGGPDCQPCQVDPTCEDGIQNGDETGVDCGGSDCQPCQTGNNCEAPTNVSVNVASASTAIVTFNAAPEAFEFIVTYEAQGVGVQTVTTSDTYMILEDLTAETNYQVQVQAVCQDGTSSAAITQFSTPAGDGGNCECGEDTHIGLALTLDNYPEETTWQLINDNGEIVAAGGDYNESGATIEESTCLEDGCYTFYITDTYGDGICCSYGNGSFEILDADENVLANGGDFGDYAALDICVDNGEIDIIEFRKAEKELTQAQIMNKPAPMNVQDNN